MFPEYINESLLVVKSRFIYINWSRVEANVSFSMWFQNGLVFSLSTKSTKILTLPKNARAGFYDVFNRLHCSIELANDDESGRSEKLCRKAANLCSRRKKPSDEAIFAGPLLTPLFLAALSLQLTISVRESALSTESTWELFWPLFCHCGSFLRELKFLWPAWNIEWKWCG